jgi:hypothetical protein
MNTIIDLLKRPGVRLSSVDTWMVWDDARKAWIVYHQGYRKRRSTEVIVTSDEAQAVAAFAREAGVKIEQGSYLIAYPDKNLQHEERHE